MKPLTGKEVIRIMLLAGWERVRRKGIHQTLKGADGAKVTVPDLGRAPLRKELVERVLSFAGLKP